MLVAIIRHFSLITGVGWRSWYTSDFLGLHLSLIWYGRHIQLWYGRLVEVVDLCQPFVIVLVVRGGTTEVFPRIFSIRP